MKEKNKNFNKANGIDNCHYSNGAKIFHFNNELYLPSGHLIYAYNSQGKNLLRVLRGHQHKVIGIRETCDSTNTSGIISCDEKGYIKRWDSSVADATTEVSSSKISLDGDFAISYFNVFDKIFILTVVESRSNTATLVWVGLKDGKKITLPPINVCPGPNVVDVSKDGNFLVAVGHRELCVLEILPYYKKKYPRIHKMRNNQATCVAIHPFKECFATGNQNGSICLWFNFFKWNPVKIILHWHTLPVQDVYFSQEGDLFSGGGECVLVRWRLNDDNKKSFLPRLGSPIQYIGGGSQDSYLSILHLDRSISIVNLREMILEGVVKRMSSHVPQNVDLALSAGLHFHKPTSALIKNGPTGHLQFFNPSSECIIYNLDITMCNFVTNERHQTLPNAEVTKATISDDGLWLVTCEECLLSSNLKEIILKFWFFSTTDQRWELNTSVQQPHSDTINAICQSSAKALDGEQVFVTCSEDGKFMVWNSITYGDVGRERNHWNCRFSKEFRNLPCSAGAFSGDASLLAVSFESCITLWKSEDYSLIGCLSQSYLEQRILDLRFSAVGDYCSALVTRSEDNICSWDLLSCSLLWRNYFSSTCLVSDDRSGLLAAFSREGKVVFFEASSSELIVSKSDISSSDVVCAAFASRNTSKTKKSLPSLYPTRLYCLNRNQEFITINVPTVDGKSLKGNLRKSKTPKMKGGVGPDVSSDPLYSALKARSRTTHSASRLHKDQDEGLVNRGVITNSLIKEMTDSNVGSMSFMCLLGSIREILPDVKSMEISGNKVKSNTINNDLSTKREPSRRRDWIGSNEQGKIEKLQKMDFKSFFKNIKKL